ncbi:MAG TPA: ABC transporter ATP-binding protein, partial [Spirochaetia bacterium]|nr:ABC transporter ATP-binding protein [Spirochaetia bacterium]
MPENLLEVNDLRTQFATEDGIVTAVDGVSFELPRGGTLGIVGESGCGKSVTSLSIMRLIPNPPGKIVAGRILFEGEDLLLKREREMRAIRGRDISMIFQEPMTSLNPIMTVGDQIIESIRLHRDEGRARARARATEMLGRVGIPTPEKRLGAFPHQLSGGLRQRVMIAMALVSDAKLLIADEPTTALDVTIQAQILRVMKRMRSELHTSIILITHDLGVVAGLADEVVVMYAGRIVERAGVRGIFKEPRHPYTAGLLDSIPSMTRERDRLQAIEGVVPNQLEILPGCPFRPRCARALERCAVEAPQLLPVEAAEASHRAACWNPRPP